MAGQKDKGGGARKYGQNKRQPSKQRYRHKAAKMRRLERLLKSNSRYAAPGWEWRDGYGLVRF